MGPRTGTSERPDRSIGDATLSTPEGLITPRLERPLTRCGDSSPTGPGLQSVQPRFPILPDLDLEFQLVAELLPDSLANPVDELEDIGRPGPRMGDDEVGVAVGDLGPADLCPLEPGLIDQGAGRDVGCGILENAAG